MHRALSVSRPHLRSIIPVVYSQRCHNMYFWGCVLNIEYFRVLPTSMCSLMLLAIMNLQYHISISSFQLPQLCILLLHINTIQGFLQAQYMEFTLAHTETYMGKGTSCVQVRHINVHTIQTTQLATYIKTCIHTCTYVHPVTVRIKVVKKTNPITLPSLV